MGTGYQGTFVISWSQTELDGFRAPSFSSLRVGATWQWTGETLCVDGPRDVLRLQGADDEENMRQRAARMVRKLVGVAVQSRETTDLSAIERDPAPLLEDGTFIVSDGSDSFTVTLIEAGPHNRPLLMFLNKMPPRNRELWVVDIAHMARFSDPERRDQGVICFTPGTLIETEHGARRVESLRPGDRVLTKDNGPQEILWTGARRMTGARLYAMPNLRPVRIFADAFGQDRPGTSFLVSPEHRMLVQGPRVAELFNTPEVLVSARSLIDARMAEIDLSIREVTYVHLLLPRHEILWANGMETESFHPASAQLSTLDEADRARLIEGMPELEHDPRSYGDFARRNLSTSEFAVLRHNAA